jgi:hypothetical protein
LSNSIIISLCLKRCASGLSHVDKKNRLPLTTLTNKTKEKADEQDEEIAGPSQAQEELKLPDMAEPSKGRKKFLRKKELKKLAKGAKTATTLDEEINGKQTRKLGMCCL